MKDLEEIKKIEVGSEKSFGIVFALFFLFISLFPLISGEAFRPWSLLLCIIFFFLAFFKPKYLGLPNRYWFKLGMLLSRIMLPIVMSMIYFLIFTPMGLLMKILRKDALRRNIDEMARTYWIKRESPLGSMKNQF